MPRSVELPALLALGAGELRQEVFIHAAQGVLGAVLGGTEADVADEIDKLAEALLVETRPGVVLGSTP